MKSSLLILTAMAALSVSMHAAGQNALEKEMDDFARDFFRAHPEAAGELRARAAREKMIKDAKSSRILELNKATEKKLRRRDEVVRPNTYADALTRLKSLNSKDPQIAFLLKYAEKEKIKTAEKLLAFRLAQRLYIKAITDAADTVNKHLAIILAKYSDYKKANNGKAPANLDALKLPEECKKFVTTQGEKTDWIYFGHLGALLKTKDSHVVIATPAPLGSLRPCGLDNGHVIGFENEQIKSQLDKIAKAIKEGTTAPGGANNNHPAASALAGLMKKYRIYKELNNDNEPSSLADLNLGDEHKQYTDPASGEKSDWIFLGKSSRISIGNGIKVVVVSPKAHAGFRLVGLSNNKMSTVKEAEIGPLLKK